MSWSNQNKNTSSYTNQSESIFPLGGYLLQEDGSSLLQESNDLILLTDGGGVNWGNQIKH